MNPHTLVDEESGELTYQRLDGLVNQYNETIIELFRCNMDLKFIGSGQSAKAILYYITDYISKSQLKMHVIYNALELAIRKFQNCPSPTSEMSQTTQDSGQAILRKTANSIIALQELSAQQVALLCLQGADHYSSHKFSYFYWTYAERFVDDISPLLLEDIYYSVNGNENDVDCSDTGPPPFDENVLIDPDNKVEQPFVRVSHEDGMKIKSSQLADYVYRPTLLQSLSLWDFIAHCTKTKLTSAKPLDDHDDEPMVSQSTEPNHQTTFEIICNASKQKNLLRFLPQHSDHKSHGINVLNHNDCFVPVLIGRGFPRRSDPASFERYCRLMLIMFKPWRIPSQIRENNSSWQSAFACFRDRDDMNLHHLKIMDNINMLHECKESRDKDYQRRFRSNPAFMPQTDHEQIIRCTDGNPMASEDDFDHDIESPDMDTTILQVAAKVEQEKNRVISDIVRKGHVSGLFGLNNYEVPQTTSVLAAQPSSSQDREMELTWQTEYERLKAQWKEEQTMLLLSHAATNVEETLTSIRQFTSDTSQSNASPTSDTNSLTMPHVPSCDLIDQVANKWTLDENQRHAFNLITTHSCERSPRQMKLFLSGSAGSGKSRVIRALQDFFSMKGESRRLRLTAYTGIAASNINGVTLHSALNLTLCTKNTRRSSKTLQELRQIWAGVHYLIIDEISMISCEFLLRISDALIQATGISEPFGGINMIFTGDLGQLPPINETRLSWQLKQPSNSLSDRSQRKMKGRALWLSIDSVIILSGNNRQNGPSNDRFRQLLERLRRGCCTENDYHLLSSRIISQCTTPTTLNEFASAPIIVSDNVAKDQLNNALARRFAHATNQELFWYMADDSIGGHPVVENSPHDRLLNALHSGHTNNRLRKLPLVIGMPVMITHNVCLEAGIVNGTIGTIHSLSYIQHANGSRSLSSCIVKISGQNNISMPNLAPNLFPILPDVVSFTFKHSSKYSVTVTRKQCPIVPAFVMTAHKSQGQTMEKAIVDLESCRGTEAPYVMVSRVKSLEGLLVFRPFNMKKIRCNASEDMRKEEGRLKTIHDSTVHRITSNVAEKRRIDVTPSDDIPPVKRRRLNENTGDSNDDDSLRI